MIEMNQKFMHMSSKSNRKRYGILSLLLAVGLAGLVIAAITYTGSVIQVINATVFFHPSNTSHYSDSYTNLTSSVVQNSTLTGWTCSSNDCNFSVYIDADGYNITPGYFNITELSISNIYYNSSDNTWRNVTELGQIGQGNWSFFNSSLSNFQVNYTLAGGDGYDYGIRDALGGGSYWLDDSGRSLETGLVGYWKFAEGSGSSTTADSSGYGNTGTLTGMNTVGNATSGWTAGKYGNALLFDGVNDYVNIADSPSISSFGSITLEAWVYPIRNAIQVVITKQYDYQLFVNSDNTIIFRVINDTTSLTSSKAVSLNAWNHIVGVWDGSTMKIFINGNQDSNTQSATGSIADSGYILDIGARTENSYFFNGTIDEVRIYNRALPAEEIRKLYESTAINLKTDFISAKAEPYIQLNLTNATDSTIFNKVTESIRLDGTPLTAAYPANASSVYFFDWASQSWKVWSKETLLDGMAGFWRFNEGSGSAADASGNGNTGTLGNSSAFTIPSWVSGKYGNALNFNGSQFVNVNDSNSLKGMSSLTIEMWYYPKTNSLGQIEKSGSYYITDWGDYKIYYRVYTTGTDCGEGGSSNTLARNNWYHVAVVYDGSKEVLYVNGAQENTRACSGNVVSQTSQLEIGASQSRGWYTNGTIDNVKIYSRALTANEIKQEYENSKPSMPDWTDTRNKQAFKWMYEFKRTNYPSINITYLMTAHDPFVRVFVDSDATIFKDDFDAETTGANPSKWAVTESGTGDVSVNTTVYQGTSGKSARFYIANSGDAAYITKRGLYGLERGTIEYYARAEQTNKRTNAFSAYKDSTYVISVDFGCGGGQSNICYYNGTNWITIQSYSANTWYHIKLDLDTRTDTYDIFVDGVLKVDNAIFREAVDKINTIEYSGDGNNYPAVGFIDGVKVSGQHNLTIPISLGQTSTSTGWYEATDNTYAGATSAEAGGENYDIWNRTGHCYNLSSGEGCQSGKYLDKNIRYFYSNTNENVLWSTVNWKAGSGKHDEFYHRVDASGPPFWTSTSRWNKLTYGYKFNSTSNNNLLFTLGYTGKINSASGNPSTWQLGFSNETLESVANSTLTWYDLKDDKLVGWWKFNEGSGSTVTDSSGWNNTGTLTNMNTTGNATSGWTAGKYGNALLFDDVNDYVDAGNPSALNIIGDQITVSAWINVLDSDAGPIVSKYGATGNQYSLQTDGTYVWLYLLNSTGSNYMRGTTGSSLIGAWHHVVGVYNKNVGKIYIDGIDRTDLDLFDGSIISTTDSVNIGASSFQNVWFNGTIDNVKIYSRALTSDEIKSDYLATKDGYPNWVKNEIASGAQHSVPLSFNYDGGAAGVWHFDEGSGTVGSDSSGYENTGIISGATWTSGKYGNALQFDGVNDYMNISNSASLKITSAITVEVWVKLSKLGSLQYVVDGQSANAYGFEMPINQTGHPQFVIRSPDTAVLSNTALVAGRWHQVVGTWDGFVQRLYVDAVEQQSTARTAAMGTHNEPLQIGIQDTIWWPVNGTIDEVRIYPRALSATEVYEHYSKEVSKYYDDFGVRIKRYAGVEDSSTNLQPITPKDTVLHLRFNDNSTVNVTDVSGFGNNGNVSGATWLTNASCRTNFGNCMGLDGSNDYVRVTHNPTIDFSTSSFSVSTWVKSITNNRGVLDKGRDKAGLYRGYALWWGGVVNYKATFDLRDTAGSVTMVNSSTTITTGDWYHIVSVRDTVADKVRIYVNGVLEQETTDATGNISNTIDLYIGSSSQEALYLNGTIDEVLIINRSLSADEVYQLYLGGYNRTVAGRTHRVASYDDLNSISFNLTDHDSSSQYDYDQRLLLISGTVTNVPLYSSESPNYASPATYTTNRNYGFQINWTGTNNNFRNAIFESNFSGSVVNYTSTTTPAVTNNTKDIFFINFTQEQFKGAYTYYYKWYGNDTDGLQNSTSQITYTINKGSSSTALSLSPSSPITYETQTTAYCTSNISQGAKCSLWRDNTNVTATENNTAFMLGNATYTYIANITATENYTAANTTSTYLVNKKTVQPSLTVTPSWTNTYPTTTTVACGYPNPVRGEVLMTLWRNNTNATSTDNNTAILLGVAAFNYVCNSTTVSANYTSNSTNNNLTINQNTTNPVNLYLNNALNQNKTIDEGTQSNATATSVYSNSGTLALYRDGLTVTNPEIATFDNGTYAYKANITGNANYSSNTTGATYYLIVNPAAGAANVLVVIAITDKANYNPTESVTFTANVSDGTNNITGASVGANITMPNGTIVRITMGETATVGTYSGIYNLSNAASGDWIYEVNATKSGYTSGRATGKFYIKITTTGCTNATYTFTGTVIDATTGLLVNSGTVTITVNELDGTLIDTASYSFSNGQFTVSPQFCLVTGRLYDFTVKIVDSSGRESYYQLKRVGKT